MFAELTQVKALIPLIPLCLLSFCSCKSAAGGACRVDEARCLDAKRELVCDPQERRFVEVPCKGKGGCVTEKERTSCDISGNAPGDACSRADEGVAFCAGGAVMLACHDRKFEPVPCRGRRGCTMLGEQANCDQSIADSGEACKKPNAKACSLDQAEVLSCVEGRMAALYQCRGEGRCNSTSGKLTCDQTIASSGDRCDAGLDGHVACSTDKKALLVCKDERFVVSERCKPGTRCAVTGQSTRCERP